MKYNLEFVNHFKKFNLISILLGIISLIFIIFKGLNYGIDFKGGTLIEIRLENKDIKISEIRDSLSNIDLGDISIKNFGKEGDYILKIKEKLEKNEVLIKKLKSTLNQSLNEDINFRRVESVGPKVSAELLKSGIISIGLALLMMLIYIWFRFEWQFSIAAIFALSHDVLTTIGLFSLLNLEFNLAIVAALLTTAGYSINDTVVVFDRVRENLRRYKSQQNIVIYNRSINETLSRTVITSLTTLLALFVIYFFGGAVLKDFALAMIWGVVIGTYSSIFIAVSSLTFFKIYKGSEDKDKSKSVIEHEL